VTAPGPICSTLQHAHASQCCAFGCALVLLRDDEPPEAMQRELRQLVSTHLAEAHQTLCLVASAAPPSNEPRYGATERSTPR
jgi:hypothetical protein